MHEKHGTLLALAHDRSTTDNGGTDHEIAESAGEDWLHNLVASGRARFNSNFNCALARVLTFTLFLRHNATHQITY